MEPFDLENTEAIPKWIRSIVDRTGPLGGLAHCAGLLQLLPVQFLNTAKIETLMRTNVTSAIMLVKAFRARGCAVRGSGVVLVSSIEAFSGDAGLSAYAASKAALIGFSRSAARELVADGLRVNCVAPATVKTFSGARSWAGRNFEAKPRPGFPSPASRAEYRRSPRCWRQ